MTTYLVVLIVLVVLSLVFRATNRPVHVGVVETSNGGRTVVFASAEIKKPSVSDPVKDSEVEVSSFQNLEEEFQGRYIGNASKPDIEAPEGMAFLAAGSSEFIQSPFSTSNCNQLFVGDDFNGLRLSKLNGSTAVFQYGGVNRFVDVTKLPLLSVDGIIVRVGPFKEDGETIDSVYVESVMLHSDSFSASYGVKITNPESALDALAYNKTDLRNMARKEVA